ncbi:MAG: hypothetical protein F6K30_17300 [Cyanothece sp. SIO2G6]|nr:hypothetical protein [Cyanothece sp. SIO2G6]
MTSLLAEAFKKAQILPEYLQDEIAQQLIEDIENEIQWQQTLAQPQPSLLDELAQQALQESANDTTNVSSIGH